MTDEYYMQLALELALKGYGKVSPNPLVGAIIVKDNNIISTGYHEQYGGFHAERNAILKCTTSTKDATIYVTLEPCCHYGKTPPCTEAIIESGIKKVVVGTLDPNPLVAGKGIEILKNAGIEVVTGVLEKECVKINEVFFHFIKNKTPFVIMKYAMTIDGKIATYTGHSKWITGEVARENVHKDRNRYTGIMVGIGTIIADNPHLTCRIDKGRNPIPIICDTNLKTPLNCNLVETAKEVKTIIATTVTQESEHKPFINKGCEIVVVPKKNNHLDLKALMSKLYEMKIDSILLEGGGTLNFSALEEQIVQKIQCYISPKLIGGSNAKTPVEGIGFPKMSDAVVLKNTTITNFGEDFLIESEVQY